MLDNHQIGCRLVEVLSNALVTLRDDGHRGHVNNILSRLDELAQSDMPLSREIAIRVLELRWMFALDDREFDKAIQYCEIGMQAVGSQSERYHVFACSLVRTYCDAGRHQDAMDVFCDVLAEGSEILETGNTLLSVVQMARQFEGVAAEDTGQVQAALLSFAQLYCSIGKEEFGRMWEAGIGRTVDRLVDRMSS